MCIENQKREEAYSERCKKNREEWITRMGPVKLAIVDTAAKIIKEAIEWMSQFLGNIEEKVQKRKGKKLKTPTRQMDEIEFGLLLYLKKELDGLTETSTPCHQTCDPFDAPLDSDSFPRADSSKKSASDQFRWKLIFDSGSHFDAAASDAGGKCQLEVVSQGYAESLVQQTQTRLSKSSCSKLSANI